ncbi:MAG: nickel insertion protein [Lentihominibacter sp.]|jgi:uncharacterized protein (DUF111 family)
MRTIYFDCTGGVSGDMVLRALEELGGHAYAHGRSYTEVKNIIDSAQEYAQRIYRVLAEAEAEVHGETSETVHFHEVGRSEAIKNALGIGMALSRLAADRILVSSIYDGKGFVDCAHGRIAVPVPAVRAMMNKSDYDFRTAEGVDTEMVTPSGLASLMGIGAEPVPRGYTITGNIIAVAKVKGTRDTGHEGLKALLIEE